VACGFALAKHRPARRSSLLLVMLVPELDPGIRPGDPRLVPLCCEDVDGRTKSGHDGEGVGIVVLL
jgi:hypothetical protein